MKLSLRQRAADLVAKAVQRTVLQWIPAEKRKGPFTGTAEFLNWIANLELEIRAEREPTPEVIAIRNWLQLAREIVSLSDTAEEVRQEKRPATEFGKATHIEGALQRVIFATLRAYHAAKLGTKPVVEAREKIQEALARFDEVIEQAVARSNDRDHPSVTQEVSKRMREAFEQAMQDLKRTPKK